MRSEARILTSVWRNPDFTALPASAQATYWMVLSQPDVTMVGVVPYMPERWRQFRGDPDGLTDDLDVLEQAGFLVVDRSTRELWIRSFAKNDGVLRSEKTRSAMWKAWHGLFSAAIRHRFLDEAGKKAVTEAVEKGWISQSDVDSARKQPRNTLSPDAQIPHHAPSSGGPSTPTPTTTPTPSTVAPAKPPRKPRSDDHSELFAALVEACGYTLPIPKVEGGKIGRCAKQLREIGATPDDVHRRAKAYRARWPDIDLTPTGLVANWAQVTAKRNGSSVRVSADACQKCGQSLQQHDSQLCAILAKAS